MNLAALTLAALFSVATPTEATKMGWEPAKFKAVSEMAFDPSRSSTDAVLIVDGSGRILFERYARGYTAEMPHAGWSVTKSLSMAVVGIAESEGILSLEDAVAKYFPERAEKTPIWKEIRLKHLLSMSTGVEWLEKYELSPFNSHVVTGLYRTKPSSDFAAYRLSVAGRVAPPGKRFNYASGETNLLMAILRKAIEAGGAGDRISYEDYPWKKLFDPIGATSVVIERDPAGTLIGSSYGHATPRDFVRFGLLFLNRGRWPDEKGRAVQVVPEKWVELASTPSPAFSELRLDHRPEMPYGHHWWLNRPMPAAQIGKPVPAFPDDAYSAAGHYGQRLYVIPSWNVIVARFGNDRNGKSFDENEFARLVAAARVKASTGRAMKEPHR